MSSTFCGLPPERLQEIDSITFANVYPPGAVLFVEGQVPRGAFLLCRGKVKLTMSAADGKTLILRLAREGEIVGLDSAVSGHPSRVTAESIEPSVLRFAKKDDLRKLMLHDTVVWQALLQLSRECDDDVAEIASLGLAHSAAEKLAKLLLEWADERGEQRNGALRVVIPMTHDHIAQMICTSRETVTRLLHDFRYHNILAVKGSAVTILNRAALEALVLTHS